MEPDLEYMSIQSLQVLNNSLMKMRMDAVVKLHALQKTNHDLITENKRLRQHVRESLSRQHGTSVINNMRTETVKRAEGMIPAPSTTVRMNQRGLMSITVQIGFDFTALVETKFALAPAQLKGYFGAEPVDFQYTMILIELKHGIVENASTVVTRNAQIKLSKLQNDMMYHITVHCTVAKGERRLTSDTKFVYHQRNATYRQCQKDHPSQQAADEPSINVSQQAYTLNVQMGDEEYITCKFNESDDHPQVARDFIGKHKLKPVLLDGIVKAMKELVSSNVTITSVDVADLL